MKTFRVKITEILVRNGLSDSEAAIVIERWSKEPVAGDFVNRMGDDIDGYHLQMVALILHSIKRVVLEWMDEEKPLHWARQMFMNEEDRNALLDEEKAGMDITHTMPVPDTGYRPQ